MSIICCGAPSSYSSSSLVELMTHHPRSSPVDMGLKSNPPPSSTEEALKLDVGQSVNFYCICFSGSFLLSQFCIFILFILITIHFHPPHSHFLCLCLNCTAKDRSFNKISMNFWLKKIEHRNQLRLLTSRTTTIWYLPWRHCEDAPLIDRVIHLNAFLWLGVRSTKGEIPVQHHSLIIITRAAAVPFFSNANKSKTPHCSGSLWGEREGGEYYKRKS